MRDDSARKYEVGNPGNPGCLICSGLNSLYRTPGPQADIRFPDDTASGFCRRLVVCPGMEFSVTSMTFNETMTMRGTEQVDMFNIAFCLGDPLSFRMQEEQAAVRIERGENYLFDRGALQGVSRFAGGQTFRGINIRLDKDLLSKLFADGPAPECCLKNDRFRKYGTSPAVNRILSDLVNCRYVGAVRRLYCEAKIMELLAVYFSETVFEDERRCALPGFSSDDIRRLRLAGKIIDADVESAPSLKKLAALVCLNEFKLKKGFKALFGLPVHAYIVERRLETARFLLENGRLKVIEAALLVGYSDPGYFAEIFRKRFGFNPSECRQ